MNDKLSPKLRSQNPGILKPQLWLLALVKPTVSPPFCEVLCLMLLVCNNFCCVTLQSGQHTETGKSDIFSLVEKIFRWMITFGSAYNNVAPSWGIFVCISQQRKWGLWILQGPWGKAGADSLNCSTHVCYIWKNRKICCCAHKRNKAIAGLRTPSNLCSIKYHRLLLLMNFVPPYQAIYTCFTVKKMCEFLYSMPGGWEIFIILYLDEIVLPGFENPYPISDHSIWFSIPYFRPDSQMYTLFQTLWDMIISATLNKIYSDIAWDTLTPQAICIFFLMQCQRQHVTGEITPDQTDEIYSQFWSKKVNSAPYVRLEKMMPFGAAHTCKAFIDYIPPLPPLFRKTLLKLVFMHKV